MAPNPRKKASIKKHHLDKKFKPWRKGKSENSTSGASLKNQLRGKKRLLSKLFRDEGDDSEKKSSAREALQVKIKELEDQIQEKGQIEKERSNAMKYHKFKFFDKKKLLRMQKKMKSQLGQSRSTSDKNLEKIAREELQRISDDLNFIQYFPNDQKYIAIFSQGTNRVAYDPKTLKRRDIICSRIEKQHGISFGKYDAPSLFDNSQQSGNESKVPTKQSQATQSKKHHSKKSSSKKSSTIGTESNDLASSKASSDSRFDSKMFQNSNIMEHADVVDKILDEEEQSKDENSQSDSSDSDSDSNLNVHSHLEGAHTNTNKNKNESSDSDDDSDSDSGSSSDDSNKSDGESDSESNDGKATVSTNNPPPPSTEITNDSSDSEDDFFAVEEEQEVNDIFCNAQKVSSKDVGARGDKSKGWATQRQLPGEFKKRRRRN